MPSSAPRDWVLLAGVIVLSTACARAHERPFACPVPHEVGDRPSKIGTEHPVLIEATSAQRRWAAFCQARADTDGDGMIEVSICGHHGEPCGDELKMYLAYGDGLEREIENYAASDPTGRHVVVVEEGRLMLVDALAGTWAQLNAKFNDEYGDLGPDLRDRPFVRFSPDGTKLVYRREQDASSVVVRDVCSGVERVVAGDDRRLLDAAFDASSTKLVLAFQEPDENGDMFIPLGAPTLGMRPPCRGPYDSWTQLGGAPHMSYRIASIDGGPATAIKREQLPPLAAPVHGAELVPNREKTGRALSVGPLRWRE